MSLEHIVITVMTDGSVKVDGPGAGELLAAMDRYFDAMGITSPQEKAAEILRLAPSAQKVMTQ
jgi:hypothetical protein